MDPTFTFASCELSGTTWIALAGELDRQVVDERGHEVRELLCGSGNVVVDTRGIEFIDLQGARLLMDLDRRVRAGGGRMQLLTSRVARNLLELIGARDLLGGPDDPELALSLGPPAVGEPPIGMWEAEGAAKRAEADGRSRRRALSRGVDETAIRARLDGRLGRYTDAQRRVIRAALDLPAGRSDP
jgi:anti-anti-sigma factor